MKCVLTFNKIEYCLIAPCLALHKYLNYNVMDNMKCIETNLNIMQNILPRMPYDDYLIAIYFKRKLEYTLIYMSSYIHLNIIMKTLQECYWTPLYIDANVSIKTNWQGLVEFTNASEKYTIGKNF